MKKKLCILGGSGLVGSTVIDYSKNDYDIIFSYNSNKIKIDGTNSFQIDLLNDVSDIEKIINLLRYDKKNKSDEPMFVLLNDLGNVEINQSVSVVDIKKAFNFSKLSILIFIFLGSFFSCSSANAAEISEGKKL